MPGLSRIASSTERPSSWPAFQRMALLLRRQKAHPAQPGNAIRSASFVQIRGAAPSSSGMCGDMKDFVNGVLILVHVGGHFFHPTEIFYGLARGYRSERVGGVALIEHFDL